MSTCMGLSELKYFLEIDTKEDGILSKQSTASQWKFEPIILHLW